MNRVVHDLGAALKDLREVNEWEEGKGKDLWDELCERSVLEMEMLAYFEGVISHCGDKVKLTYIESTQQPSGFCVDGGSEASTGLYSHDPSFPIFGCLFFFFFLPKASRANRLC